MSQIAFEILERAARVVEELLGEAASAALTPDEGRGLVAVAIEVGS